VDPGGYLLVDGSGLSVRNLAAPRTVVKLLTHMYFSEERDGWMDLMAIGGEDGTLSHRFRSDGMRGRVLAKTGTLTGACALSGYAETRSGRRLAFSIMANNYVGPAREARRFIDGIVEALLDQ
jgi:D-alanyl-D-alanine carboxypeptidase/D-alanyl-D-alanine-endopeptidase (penicillin-binding protein 4)